MTCEGCLFMSKDTMGEKDILEFWVCNRHPKKERKVVVYDKQVVLKDRIPSWCPGKIDGRGGR